MKKQKLQRLFLIGPFSDTDEATLRVSLSQEGNSAGAPLMIVRVPYRDPISAAGVLARLFKVHLLLDWLVQMLRMEQLSLRNSEITPITDATNSYIRAIKQRPWAYKVIQALQTVIDGGLSKHLTDVYQDAFVGSDDFISSFKEHFQKTAMNKQDLLRAFAPIWNDMVVLCDFAQDNDSNLNIFPAACFAAYHEAPLLLFPAISAGKEHFLNERVLKLERRITDFTLPNSAEKEQIPYEQILRQEGHATNLTTRHVRPAREFADNTRDIDLAGLVLPWDVQVALQSLNPLTVALYSTDAKVPYEVVSDQMGPMGLKYVIGRLGGTDAYDTSLIAASGMLYAHEMQRYDCLHILLCFVNLPRLPHLHLEEEEKLIVEALKTRSEHFTVEILKESKDLRKEQVLKKLGESTHIFHYAGHGYDGFEWPQRSGIVLLNLDQDHISPLNALEIKYRVRLGAHPIVFLNSCFSSSNSRIMLEEKGEQLASQITTEETNNSKENSQTAKNTQQIMGVSSSFIHIGAAAVMAPLWDIVDNDAIAYARHWYKYLIQGCSIGEASLLARIDSLQDAEKQAREGKNVFSRYGVLSYVIYGDPTLRLYPLQYLIEHHSETIHRLLQIKRDSLGSEA